MTELTFARVSLVDLNVQAEVSFCLNIGLMVSHLEVIVDEVHHEVREPWVLTFTLSLKETAEQAEALLAKVIAEHLEAHEGGVLIETLCKEGQAEVFNVIVSHVQVDE